MLSMLFMVRRYKNDFLNELLSSRSSYSNRRSVHIDICNLI